MANMSLTPSNPNAYDDNEEYRKGSFIFKSHDDTLAFGILIISYISCISVIQNMMMMRLMMMNHML